MQMARIVNHVDPVELSSNSLCPLCPLWLNLFLYCALLDRADAEAEVADFGVGAVRFARSARIRCFWKVSSWTIVELVTVTSSTPRRSRPGRRVAGQRFAGGGLPGGGEIGVGLDAAVAAGGDQLGQHVADFLWVGGRSDGAARARGGRRSRRRRRRA